MSVTVTASGALSLLQDAGRPGFASQGVGHSGAFDRRAWRQANDLVGNMDDPAVIEVLLGGLTLVTDADIVVAVTGAVGPITVAGTPATHGRAMRLQAGQALALGTFIWGVRAHVAVAGGWQAEPELGSRSRDTLAGLGPAPLTPGDHLETGAPRNIPLMDDVTPLTRGSEIELDVVLGPRDDWFTAAGVRTLLDTPWAAAATSDRIGVRLDGPVIERAITRELPSEPCVRGSIQVATDGRPIVFGPDHPVTGGYPVIAVVTDATVDRLAQARPGDVVRFRRAAASS